MRERDSRTRRAFLKVAAAFGAIQASGVALAQDDENGDDGGDGESQQIQQRVIELEGHVSGWQGVAPEQIEGEENPTLVLSSGTEYVVEWANGDGQPHNFVVEDENEEELVATDIITSGSQEVEITASEEMSEYYCEPHSQSMRGDIEIAEFETPDREKREEPAEGEAEGADEGGGDQSQQQDDPSIGDDVDPNAEPVATVELERREDGWYAVSPSQIEGETNPTLRLMEGEVYEIVVTSDLEVEDHLIGPNLIVTNEDGDAIAHTDFFGEDLDEDSVLFLADDRATQYFDQTELDVGGDIEVVSSGN